ncbi:MAG: phage holin family protein [Alteraurantiacibacter sp.]
MADKIDIQPKRSGSAGDQQESASVVDLLGQLTSQGSHLAQQQVNLVQAELREGIDDLKIAIGSLVGAAVVGISGLGVVLMGLGVWLGDGLDNLQLGIIIVGLITLAIAFFMFQAAKKKMSAANLKPERTIETAERTPDAATGNLTNNGAR